MLRPSVKQASPRRWELLAEFCRDGDCVPTGFISDGASVPRILWWFIRPEGAAFYPAIMHDYLYRTKTGTKERADKLFYTMCLEYGLGKFQSKMAYIAVKLLGKF